LAGTVFGPYQLLEPLGRGGMGEVWRAYDSARLERFRREARAVSRLSDRRIIPIYPHGEIDGKLYMGMRLVEGRDLTAVLADGVAMARSGRAVSDRLRRAEASVFRPPPDALRPDVPGGRPPWWVRSVVRFVTVTRMCILGARVRPRYTLIRKRDNEVDSIVEVLHTEMRCSRAVLMACDGPDVRSGTNGSYPGMPESVRLLALRARTI